MRSKQFVARCSAALAAATVLLPVGAAGAQAKTSFTPTPSTTYAGYSESYDNNNFSVSETLVVPTLVCTKKTTDPITIFAQTYGAGSSSQTLGTAAVLQLSCAGTQPFYTTALVVDNAGNAGVSVSAGDQITLHAGVTATTEQASVTDNTTDQSASVAGTGYAPEGLDSLVDPNSPTGAFPKFSPIQFTSVSWNDDRIPPTGIQSFNKVDGQNRVQLKVSAVTQGRTAFAVTFIRNS